MRRQRVNVLSTFTGTGEVKRVIRFLDGSVVMALFATMVTGNPDLMCLLCN
jgi:hypothetical protein